MADLAFQHPASNLEVDQRGRADVALSVTGAASSIDVSAAGASVVDTESSSIGDVIGSKTISEIPLNGRFFLDLAVLVPGSVMGSTNNRNGNTSASAFGSFSINSSGARSDSASFMIDGINMNDGTQITFQPSIESVQEFKVQSNSFSAEYGRTAGIIINGVTTISPEPIRFMAVYSSSSEMRSSMPSTTSTPPRDVQRQRTGSDIAPFKRNIFGESVGGPVFLPGYDGRNQTFFFEDYEGRRLRQTETFTTTVPTVAQRAAVTNPTVAQLLSLLPLPNNVGSLPPSYREARRRSRPMQLRPTIRARGFPNTTSTSSSRHATRFSRSGT